MGRYDYTNTLEDRARGDTWRFVITVESSPSVPLNLTDCKVWMTGKKALADPDSQAVFQCSTDPGEGIVVTNAVGGILAVVVLPGASDSLPAANTKLFCDVQVRNAAGDITTYWTGAFTVKPETTRTTS
jgi:hypothetical protein